MTTTLIGYARCSINRQDRAAQQKALLDLGVAEDHIYTDHGLTGATHTRPGLDLARAAVREGDALAVPKLDRLARSVPDAHAIARAKGKCAASSRNCPSDSSGNSAAYVSPANIPSAISPNSSPSQDQPSIAHSTAAFPLSVRLCPLLESTRSRTLTTQNVILCERIRRYRRGAA